MTYEYFCRNCKKEWEEQQSINSEKIKKCPFCNNDTAERLISKSVGGFILQGGCWGKDNYSK